MSASYMTAASREELRKIALKLEGELENQLTYLSRTTSFSPDQILARSKALETVAKTYAIVRNQLREG